MDVQQFETPGPVELRIRNRSGWVEVTTHDTPETTVDVRALSQDAEDLVRDTEVSLTPAADGQRVVVDVPDFDAGRGWLGRSRGVGVRVTVPVGTRLHLKTASADIRATGTFGIAQVEAASGDVWLDTIGAEGLVRTASGEVHIEAAGAALAVYTASGDIMVGRAAGPVQCHSASGDQLIEILDGDAECESASGDIRIGRLAGELSARTASGDITIGASRRDLSLASRSGDVDVRCAIQGRLVLQSISGDVTVAVAEGSRVAIDAHTRSGDAVSEIPLQEVPPATDTPAPLVDVQAHTISGDVHIVRARARSAS
jgi:hypothetical protein